METLQDCNRRQKDIKIEVNHLAFDSRNEWDNNINQPGTNSTSLKDDNNIDLSRKRRTFTIRRYEDDIYSDQTEVKNRPF